MLGHKTVQVCISMWNNETHGIHPWLCETYSEKNWKTKKEEMLTERGKERDRKKNPHNHRHTKFKPYRHFLCFVHSKQRVWRGLLLHRVQGTSSLFGVVRLETWVAKWRHHSGVDGQVTPRFRSKPSQPRPNDGCLVRGEAPDAGAAPARWWRPLPSCFTASCCTHTAPRQHAHTHTQRTSRQ